jgi:hypothetical protein
MNERNTSAPVADSTAVRVALWRALHVQIDPPPHVFEDEIGLQLAAPEEGWRSRPNMNPNFTRKGCGQAARLLSAFSLQRRFWPWPVNQDSKRPGMCRLP